MQNNNILLFVRSLSLTSLIKALQLSNQIKSNQIYLPTQNMKEKKQTENQK